ncbi:MAG: putative transport system permease protein [Verrucomicrobiota bacterium]|nr:putative transport system permease protein [Verrucomicrobiota bacterium]
MRFALRSLLKTPGFTIIALLTLALGIGVNTSMFSLLDALLFKAAPFPEPDRLVMLQRIERQDQDTEFSATELNDIREKSTAFSEKFVFTRDFSAVADAGQPPERLNGILADAGLFITLGVQPQIGRPFTAEECQPGKGQVVLLAYSHWQDRYGGDPSVLGRVLRIDGDPHTIIGVMPAAFEYRFLWGGSAFWRPLSFTPEQSRNRGIRIFSLIGRLQSGREREQVAAELGPLSSAWQQEFPQDYADMRFAAPLLHEALMDGESRKISWMLLSLSGFVLLIACANLANLQLARATVSVREFAIRAALGASRARLIGQQLTECLLLSLVGGGLGLLIALWVNSLLEANVRIGDKLGGLELPIDRGVLLATIAASVLTGVIFGIVPAWIASRTDVVGTLKSQGRGTTSARSHHRLRHALVIAEVTLALVLLGGAGMMQRGFARILALETGWDTKHVLTGVLPMPEKRYETPERRLEFFRSIETRVGGLPGVQSVALSTSLPLWHYGNTRQITNESLSGADPTTLPRASHVMVTSGYFDTLGIRLVEGRIFAADVKAGDAEQVVINDALAQQFWPTGSPLGQRLGLVHNGQTKWVEIIGVVRSAQSAVAFTNPPTGFHVYRSVAHEPWTWIRFAVRSENPAALIESVRRAVAEVDPDLPADQLMTVDQFVERQQHNLIIVAQLLTGFAGLGLVLAAVGLYGVISNIVAQRTGEFGIRLALGAKPSDVLKLVLGRGLLLTAIGLVLGMAGAYALGLFLGSFMPRMIATDPVALAGTAAILFAVAALACWLPARRATRVDPLEALRAE